jgi:DNA-binding CsgD family transcriptional regulator
MEIQRDEIRLSSRAADERTVRRGRRSDAGSFRASERDTELLYLVGEQYALTLPQLARLIGRSPHTARALRDRWKRAGWIGSGKLAVHAPPFVWLTGRGAAVAQSPFRPWRPNHGLALHIEAVTEVRLLLEDELRLGELECERSIARRFAEYRGLRTHLPDAILTTSEGQIAIEVELTLKNRARLAEIARETGGAYHRIWYFARPTLIPALQTIAAESAWQNIHIYPYPPTPGDLPR